MANTITTQLLPPSATLRDLSDDGRFLAYTTTSGGTQSLYVLTVANGASTFISSAPVTTDSGGYQVGGVTGGELSSDGRYVFYLSSAGGLLLKDLQAGAAPPKDVTPAFSPPPAPYDEVSLTPKAVSTDGQFVFFHKDFVDSVSSLESYQGYFRENVTTGELVAIDPSHTIDFGLQITPDGQKAAVSGGPSEDVVDFQQNTTTNLGAFPTGDISDDGRSFVGDALVNNQEQVVLHNILFPGVPDRIVSASALGTASNGDETGFLGLSGDGLHVAFRSDATNLVPGHTDGSENVYVKDLDSNAIQFIGPASQLTPDAQGEFRVFLSYDGSVLVSGGSNGISETTFIPPTIGITAINGGQTINAAEETKSITLTGVSSLPYTRVTITSPSGAVSTTVTGSDGSWTATVAATGVADGSHAFTADITDNLGHTGSASLSATFDVTPPTLIIASVTADNIVDAAEAKQLVDFHGTSDAIRQTLTLSIDGSVIGQPVVDQNGQWFVLSAVSYADGTHTIDAKVADAAGNVTDHSTSFLVDTVPPKIAITSISGDDVINATEVQTSVPVVGTSDAIGQTVTLTADNKVVGTAVVQTDGSWTANVSLAGTSGATIVFASVADPAGNIGAATATALIDSNIRRVSVKADGTQGTGDPNFTFGFTVNSVSDDGRFVLFVADGNATFEPNPSYKPQVLLKDNAKGVVSVVGTGYDSQLSGNGRYALFVSSVANTGAYQVVDLTTGTATVANTTATGAADNGGPVNSTYPKISDDGRYVVFTSSGTNLVAGLPAQDGNNPADRVFVKDMVTGAVSLVSFVAPDTLNYGPPSGIGGNRYVAFTTSLSGGGNDTNNKADIYVRDIQTGAVTLVSSTPGGVAGNNNSLYPSISPDGRYVAFYSSATNLVAGQTYSTPQAYVRDLQTGTTTLLSADASGNAIGAYATGGEPNFVFTSDDRYVAFYTSAKSSAGDTNTSVDIYLKDRQTGALQLLSSGGSGPTTGSSAFTYNFDLAPSGSFVTFSTNDPNLVPYDTNSLNDIFIRRLTASATLTFNPVTGDNVIALSERSPLLAVGGSATVVGGTVAVTIDGTQAGTAVVANDGTWTTNVDVTLLAGGTHAFAATVQDQAGFSTSGGAIVNVLGDGASGRIKLIYDDAGHVIERIDYDNAGQPLEDFTFDTSGRLTSQAQYRNGALAFAVTYYPGTLKQDEVIQKGITGASYDEYDYTYAANGTPIHQILYAGAHVKIYNYSFDPATGNKVTSFYDATTGAPTKTQTMNGDGTSETRVYQPSGASNDFFYDASNHLAKRDIYATLTRKSETLTYDTAGRVTSDTSFDAQGNTSYAVTYYPGTTNKQHVDQYGITGVSYTALHIDYDPGNVQATETLDLAGGGYAKIASGNNRTLTSTPDIYDTLQASGNNETYVFHANMGQANMGADNITTFLPTGAGHDVMQFDASMFPAGDANANYLLDTYATDIAATSGQNAQPASVLLTFDANNSVQAFGTTIATLRANPQDFAFV